MRFSWILIAVLAVYWCTDQSDPLQVADEQISVSFEQLPGCLDTYLIKTSIRDSVCFYYTFEQNLDLEFCVQANCCPDTNRFDFLTNVRNDTIYFTVLDTARNLCDCSCEYLVQTEIAGLQNDRYNFQCIYYNEIIYDTMLVSQLEQTKINY